MCAKSQVVRDVGALAARGQDQVLWDVARVLGPVLKFPAGRGWEEFHTVSPGAKCCDT